jgi:aspartate/methionine/tyrosine aminotransferase
MRHDLRPTAVNAILGEVRKVQATGASVISLMRGEPDFRTPAHIVDACTRSLADGRTTYPDNRGERALRDAVAAKLARANGVTYDPLSEVLVTTGATMGIYAALMALLSDGDEVLVPDPIYDAYQSPIRLAGGRSRAVPAVVADGRFALTRDALEGAVTPSSRVLLLNSPWNPVGTVLREAEWREIGEFAARHDLTIISDEIYEAIVYDGHRHISPASLSDDLRRRTVVVNSLSKTYAMTGWRIGYCAAPAAVIDAMFLVLQQSSRGPATFIQDAAAAALNGPQDCVEQMRREYESRRAAVAQALAGLPNVRVLQPEGGFFSMVDVRALGRPSDDIRRSLLNDHGVAVVHGSAYGAGGEGTLRVSFGSGGENLGEGLRRLRLGLSG